MFFSCGEGISSRCIGRSERKSLLFSTMKWRGFYDLPWKMAGPAEVAIVPSRDGSYPFSCRAKGRFLLVALRRVSHCLHVSNLAIGLK
jgi:hypothetical protein